MCYNRQNKESTLLSPNPRSPRLTRISTAVDSVRHEFYYILAHYVVGALLYLSQKRIYHYVELYQRKAKSCK